MPQPGEIRRGSTESVQWDGSRWTPLDESSAQQGYHPSVADSAHPWLAAGKGFLSGVAEAATPGKVGLLGALAIPGAGEAALTAAGTQALAEFLRAHYKTANAPTSFGEAAGDVGGAALGAGIKGPINAGVKLASKVVKNPQALSGGLGATVGGYEGYKRGGIPGAVEGAILGGAGGTMLGTRFGSLRKAAGMAADVAPEAAAAKAAPAIRSTDVSTPHYPDLMDEYTASAAKGPGSGKQSFEMGGRTYRPNAQGSHVADPELPSFTHEGQAFQPGEPPAVGGTEIPGTGFSPRGVRDARGDMSAQAIDRLKRAIDVPAVKQDIYAASGDHFGDLGGVRNNGSFDPQLSNYPEPTPSREDLAAELARRLGTPSDAEVLASLTTRNTTGKWPR